MSPHQGSDSHFFKDLRKKIFGDPKDLHDSSVYHTMALMPALAWIGLGADGLSSSAYGPEEAFHALGEHTYLLFFISLATAFTVILISYAYSQIIEAFPSGGGGYLVATKTLGERAGVISGSALIIDYILTITVSIVSCGNAIFSYLPPYFHPYKMGFEAILIIILIILNIRGVKESVTILAPIFVVFVITHIAMIGIGIYSHVNDIDVVASSIRTNLDSDLKMLGLFGVLKLFFHSYSMGGGTYTGIEAVSNGLQIMKEPKVKTAKRTMLYMASSLTLTAVGLLLCYLLFKVHPMSGRTLNSVLADQVFSSYPLGALIAWITIFSEGALLFVAAQAGFIDAPRVMANMAIDRWFPTRFASLSERLTMRNGIVIIGGAALGILFYTKGAIGVLIVMYSINVFVTFSLSFGGMVRHTLRNTKSDRFWFPHLIVYFIGLLLSLCILIVTTIDKLTEGGWLTLVITSMLIYVCYRIKRHYNKVRLALIDLNQKHQNRDDIGFINDEEVDASKRTAIQLVSGYNGFGIETFQSIMDHFPNVYENIIFASVAVIDSGSFKGADEVMRLEEKMRFDLRKLVDLARLKGFRADYRMLTGTDVNESAVELCRSIHLEFKNSIVFTGSLVFKQEKFYHSIFHNNTSVYLQRKLQDDAIMTVVLPVHV